MAETPPESLLRRVRRLEQELQHLKRDLGLTMLANPRPSVACGVGTSLLYIVDPHVVILDVHELRFATTWRRHECHLPPWLIPCA